VQVSVEPIDIEPLRPALPAGGVSAVVVPLGVPGPPGATGLATVTVSLP
jgi:hypothetical protein